MNAYKNDKIMDVYYALGRLSYLILYFDPIEFAALEPKIKDSIEYLGGLITTLANGLDQIRKNEDKQE